MRQRQRQRSRSIRRLATLPAAGGHRPLLLAMALATGFGAVPARAQPAGAQAIHGSAALAQQGNRLLVTTQNGAGTSHSAINWQSFSIPAGTATHFAQPHAGSTSINRVLGPDPSAIFGTLSSNGRLVLVNPAGITVGPGAVVDTAGFTASTLRMADADAIAGRLRFADGVLGSLLRVDGQVLAREGDVVLIGQDVQVGAQALVHSPQGAAVLAAGSKVEITGRGVEGITFQVQAPQDQALNLGTLRGDAVGVFAGTLRHSGLVQAQAVSTEGGKVVLRAADQALVAGTVQAQGLAGAGGSVDVLGAKVGLAAGARVDTSSTAGGGRIRVGGDYQGSNAAVPNAQVTYVDADAQLLANATQQGDGGRVIVWADDTTRMHGRIEARGGAQGGDGGFVETSGKRYLDLAGARVSASAAQGRAGTWLLDPDDITIAPGAATAPAPSAAPVVDLTPADTGSSVVTDGTLNAALDARDGTNVIVAATSTGLGSGGITVLGGVNLARTAAGSASLELRASGDIVFARNLGTGADRINIQALQGGSTDGAQRSLDVLLKPGYGNESWGPSIRTDSGVTVQVSTDGSAHRAAVVVGSGRSWENDGTLTLNLNGQLLLGDGYGAASFVNDGRVDGSGGAGAGEVSQRTTTGGIGGWRTAADAWGAPVLGDFTNNGVVALEHSAVHLSSLRQPTPAPSASPAPAPSFSITGGRGSLQVTETFEPGAGSFGFDGTELSIVQRYGALGLGNGTAAIKATGDIRLETGDGRITVDRELQSSTGEVRITAGASIASGGGTIELLAPITAPRVTLQATDGYYTVREGDSIQQAVAGAGIAAGELTVLADGGVTLAGTGNRIARLAASVGSLDLRNQAATLVVGPTTASQAEAAFQERPFAQGNVRIANEAPAGATDPASGSIDLPDGVTLEAGGIQLHAAGDIRLAGDLRATWGLERTPQVVLSAGRDITQSGGAVQANELIAHAGGSVQLDQDNSVQAVAGSAGGAFHLRTGGSLDVRHLYAPGDAAGTDGIRAGSVNLAAGYSLSVDATITTTGGAVSLTAADPSFFGGEGGGYGSLELHGVIDTTDGGRVPGGDVTLVGRATGYGYGEGEGYEGGLSTGVGLYGTVTAGSGRVTVQAASSIELDGASVTAGSVSLSAGGVLDIWGGSTIAAAGRVDATAGSDIYVDGSAITAAGIGMAASSGNVHAWGSTLAAGTGALRLSADRGTLDISGSSLGGASLELRGGDAAPAAGPGVVVEDSTLAAATGGLEIVGSSAGGNGYAPGVVFGGANRIDVAAGQVATVRGDVTATPEPTYAPGPAVLVTGTLGGSGELHLTGKSVADAPAVALSGATLDRQGGLLLAEGAGHAGPAVRIDSSEIRTGGGGFTISAAHEATIHYSAIDTSAPGPATVGGPISVDSAKGLWIHGSTLATGGGQVRLVAGNSTDGIGIAIDNASSVHAGSGGVEVRGTAGEGPGFYFAGYGGYTISGADVVLSGTSATGGTAVHIDAERVEATGSLTVTASGGDLWVRDSSLSNTGSGGASLTATNGAVRLEGSSLANGAGQLLIRSSGTPSAISVDAGTTIASAGELRLVADDVTLDGAITGTGRTVLQPLDANRAITIGGAAPGGTLHFTQAMLDRLQGGGVVIGDTTQAGGIRVRGSVDVATAPWLSLLSAGAVAQDTGTTVRVQQLHAQGSDVDLKGIEFSGSDNALSGRATAGNFTVWNVRPTPAPLRVGTVDGQAGIQAAGAVTLVTPGALQLDGTVASHAVGTAITLAAGGDFSATAAGALQAPNGRWLVHLPTPSTSMAGSTADGTVAAPDSGNDAVWNLAYDRNAVPTVADAGNRYVFAVQPTAVLTATDQAKVYDGTDAFNLAWTASTGYAPALYGNAFRETFGVPLAIVGASRHVGSYTIGLQPAAAITAPTGMLVAPLVTGTATITPRALTVSVAAADKVYDSTTAATVALASDALAGDTVALSGTAAAFADRHVGAGKTVTVSGLALAGADAGNYTLVNTTAYGSASITPATLTLAGLLALDKVYDGNRDAALAGTATLGGVYAGDVVAAAGPFTGTFDTRNAGAGKAVSVSGGTLSGADAGNYVLATTTLSASITPATLSAPGLSAASKTYDGTTAATLAGTGLAGLVAGDSVALSASGARFADADAGTGKAVSAGTVTLTGADAGNYVLGALPTLRADITPAPLTIRAVDQNKQQGTAIQFAGTEFLASGLVGSDGISRVSLSSTGAGTEAAFGVYPLLASGAVGATGTRLANYSITYEPGSLVVSGLSTPVQQVQSLTVAFLKMYVEEATRPAASAPSSSGSSGDDKDRKNKDAIVQTDNACKPS